MSDFVDRRSNSFEGQPERWREPSERSCSLNVQLLPGTFNGGISKLLTAGSVVIAVGKFDQIEGRGGFGATRASNIAWLDLSNPQGGWKTTLSPIPLERISDAVWCDAGLFVGGIGGTYCIVPGMGLPNDLAQLSMRDNPALKGSPLSALAPGGHSSMIRASTSLEGVRMPQVSREVTQSTGQNATKLAAVLGSARDPSSLPFNRFQNQYFECRALAVYQSQVVAGFSSAMENWNYACTGGWRETPTGDDAIRRLAEKVGRENSAIVAWDARAMEWKSMGRIPGVVRSLAVTEDASPKLFAINAVGGFFRYDGGRDWVQVKDFSLRPEPIPHKLRVYGSNIVLCLSAGGYGDDKPAAQIYDAERMEFKSLPVVAAAGCGVNDVQLLGGSIVITGQMMRLQAERRSAGFFKESDWTNAIVIGSDGAIHKESFRRAYRSGCTAVLPPAAGRPGLHSMLLSHVDEVQDLRLGVQAKKSVIEMLQIAV